MSTAWSYEKKRCSSNKHELLFLRKEDLELVRRKPLKYIRMRVPASPVGILVTVYFTLPVSER